MAPSVRTGGSATAGQAASPPRNIHGYTGTMSAVTYLYGKGYTLPVNRFEADNDLFRFIGWNTKADGSGNTYEDQAVVRNLSPMNGETITLYALWEIDKPNAEQNLENLANYILENGTQIDEAKVLSIKDIPIDDNITAESEIAYLANEGILAFMAVFKTPSGNIHTQIDYDLLNKKYTDLAITYISNSLVVLTAEVEIVPESYRLLQEVNILRYECEPTDSYSSTFVTILSKAYTKYSFAVWEWLLENETDYKFTDIGFPVIFTN